MASKGRSVSDKPLDWAAFFDRVQLARRLVSIGAEQVRKAQTDFDLARVGLAELEADLAARGIAPSDDGEGGAS